MLVPGMYLADRYEILEKIGSGGMADVYKAKCHKLNRLVAVKVLKNEFSTDATFVRKFRVEAQSAAGLSHPNIVNVYDVGEESGIYFIVMELVQGITLKNYIDMKGKLEVREALNISIQIASGLSAAHQNRIIHRDVKPQNIIMSRDGKVKVTDFGIAKVADSTTVTTTAAGSVHYISPEQARGGYSDEKSDIYSLGITMYEMLTGRVPFDGETNVAVALLHIQGEMVPPRRLEPSIPRSYEKIILKCTQKKPDRRYASAKELIADLRRVLSNPDGEYVILAGSVTDSQTLVMSEDDIQSVRQGRGGQIRQADVGGQGMQRQPGQQRGQHQNGDEQRRQEELRRQRAMEERQRSMEERRRMFAEEEDDDDDDDDSEVNPRLEKVMIGLGIVGAVILVIAVCFIIGRAVGLIGGGSGDDGKETDTKPQTESMTDTESETDEKEYKMVSLLRYTKDEAEKKLRDAGITKENGFTIEFEEQSDEEEKDTVIEQDPAAGTMITSDVKITVVVSSGKDKFKLGGGYAGLTQEQAESKLRSRGLNAYIDFEYSNTYDYGLVTRTDPGEDAEVSEGDTITLYISRGKEVKEVAMPSIVGQTESEAKSRVEGAGLKWGTPTTAYSDDVAKGNVISFTVDGQAVYEGTNVEEGKTVVAVISAGSEMEGKNVKETCHLSDGPEDATGHMKAVRQSTGEVVWEKEEWTNADWPVNFTVEGLYGTTDVIVCYLNGEWIGQQQVYFDGK